MVSTRVIPNRSVNFAQEFHHFDGQGGEIRRCIPGSWQGLFDRSVVLAIALALQIQYCYGTQHDCESLRDISLSGACDGAAVMAKQTQSLMMRKELWQLRS